MNQLVERGWGEIMPDSFTSRGWVALRGFGGGNVSALNFSGGAELPLCQNPAFGKRKEAMAIQAAQQRLP